MELIKAIMDSINKQLLVLEQLGVTDQSKEILSALTEALRQAIKAA